MKKAFVIFLGACLIGTFTFAAGSSSNSSSSSDRYGASSAETNRFSKINALIRLEKEIAKPGYAENVKDIIKAQNMDKIEGLKKKVADLDAAIANMERLAQLEKKE